MEEKEAPSAASIPKPKITLPTNFITPNDAKKLDLKSDKNNEFEIQLYIFEEYIIFEGTSKKLIPQKRYKKIYTLNDIQKNKFFLIYENINEIYEEIQNQINEKEKQLKLIEKENKLILNIPLNIKKINELLFEIDEIVENISIKINDLYSYINKLTKEVDDLNEKNKKLEEKNKILEEKTKILEERVNKEEEGKKNNWKRYINSTIVIRVYGENKNLDIEGGIKLENGIKIISSLAHGNWNQKFKMVLNQDGSVSFLNGNFAIDAFGGIAKNGTQINIWQINNTNSQKFFIENVGNDWYRIISLLDVNYCIDICSDNKTKIQLWKKNDSNSQKFRFVE